MNKKDTYSVLFVGNSYTYYNDLWDIFQQCAESAGYHVTVDSVTSGGYHLYQYLDSSDFQAQVFNKRVTQNTYDYVILQDHSTGPIEDYDAFAQAVKTIVDLLPEDTHVVLYQTWGRQEDSETLTKLGLTNETMTQALAEAYQKLGAELDIPVSPVGTAFRDVHVNHPEIELYNMDHTHPSPAGSYLAALTHFAVLTGDSPENVTYDGGQDPGAAQILREAAARAVNGEE